MYGVDGENIYGGLNKDVAEARLGSILAVELTFFRVSNCTPSYVLFLVLFAVNSRGGYLEACHFLFEDPRCQVPHVLGFYADFENETTRLTCPSPPKLQKTAQHTTNYLQPL